MDMGRCKQAHAGGRIRWGSGGDFAGFRIVCASEHCSPSSTLVRIMGIKRGIRLLAHARLGRLRGEHPGIIPSNYSREGDGGGRSPVSSMPGGAASTLIGLELVGGIATRAERGVNWVVDSIGARSIMAGSGGGLRQSDREEVPIPPGRWANQQIPFTNSQRRRKLAIYKRFHNRNYSPNRVLLPLSKSRQYHSLTPHLRNAPIPHTYSSLTPTTHPHCERGQGESSERPFI
jgi:hypothetical protein